MSNYWGARCIVCSKETTFDYECCGDLDCAFTILKRKGN